MIKSLFKISFRNVFAHWRSNAAALLSISAAFFVLSLFYGYVENISLTFFDIFAAKSMYGHVIIEKPVLSETITGDLPLKLNLKEQTWIDSYFQKSGDVLRRVRFLEISGMVTNGHNNSMFMGYGYDTKEGAELRGSWDWNTLAGRPLQFGEPDSMVMGRALAHIMNCDPSSQENYVLGLTGYIPKERPFHCETDSFQLTSNTVKGQANAIDGIVIGIVDGIYREIDSQLLILPLPQAQSLFDTNEINWVSVQLKEKNAASQFVENFNAAAKQNGILAKAQTLENHRFGEAAVVTLDWMNNLKVLIVIILLGIVGLSVLSTIYRIIDDRTNEIGTLRSLGFRQSYIFTLISLESLFLGLLGSLLGTVFSIIGSGLINWSHFTYQTGMISDPVPFQITLTYQILFQILFWLSILCWVASVWPALRTSQRKITECINM
jgi:putative ABC transport system permease protein